MSRKRIASRCQFHMISTIHHYLVARLDAAQDLYFLAIACTEFHLLLLVTFLTLLDVDEKIRPMDWSISFSGEFVRNSGFSDFHSQDKSESAF